MTESKFNLDAIIETLQGTCMEDLASAISYHNPELTEDDLTADDHSYIDQNVFKCPECGWWCEDSQRKYSEETSEDLCEDCIGSIDEDED